MSSGAPTPPPPPDPSTIINASAGAANQAATTQAKLNNVNYSGPQGQVSYNYNPATGQFTENVGLNPTLQAASDNYQYDQRLGADVAGKQLQQIQGVMGQQLTPPQMASTIHPGSIATSYNQGGAIQNGVQNTGVQTGFGDSGSIQGAIASPGAIQAQVAPTYSPFGTLGMGQGGGLSPPAGGGGQQGGQATGNQPSAANQSNQALLQQTQQLFGDGTNAAHVGAFESWLQGGGSQLPAAQQQVYDQLQAQHPEYNAAQLDFLSFQPHLSADGQSRLSQLGGGQPQAQTPQGAAPAATPTAQQPQQPQQPQAQAGPATGAPQGQMDPLAAIASNPVASTQLATYQQAKQMLDPQWNQAAEQQQAQLVAQGLNPNSAAYQNAMQIFGNQQNNAYNSAVYSAINAGDQEQNTLYGQNLNSAQYALGAQNQNYNQLVGQAQLGNSAQLQNYDEQLGRAQLYNSANGQLFGQNLAQGQFANTAQAQQNSENAAAAGFQNTAQGQSVQQQLAAAQLANSAAQQNFQNQAYVQSQPINNFNALMSSSQVGLPPSAPAQNTQVSTPNVLGAYQLNTDAQMAAYQQQAQNYQSGLGGLFNLGSAAITAAGPAMLAMSDMRLKRDVIPLARRRDGIGVYAFRYRAHPGWHVGVMAQEVQRIRPDAVFEQSGLLGVDYGRLAA